MGFSITEENIAKPQPKPVRFGPGIYGFMVGKLEKRDSEAGNRYLSMEILVEHEGRHVKMRDQLMFIDAEWAGNYYTRFLQCVGIDPMDHPAQDNEEQCDALMNELVGRVGSLRARKQKDSDYCEVARYFLSEEAAEETFGPFPEKKSREEKPTVIGDTPF